MNKSGFTPLIAAALCGHIEVAKYLVEAGADLDHDCWLGDGGGTPLIYAVKRGFRVLARFLLAAGADVFKARQSDQSTALHIAAGKEDEDLGR